MRETFLRSCGSIIEAAIARRDTRHPIFHGCYDWHSAVHGHFALLRLSRVLEDSRYADLATAELTADRIVAEAADLRERTSFEMPYGRAWFLRLAIEHAIVTGSEALRGMATELARSLVERYDHVAPHPATREYANASWALVQLAAWARHAGNAGLADWVDHAIERDFLDPDEVPALDDDRHEPDFFSPRGNWLYLLAHTQPAALDRVIDSLDASQLRPVHVTGRAHHYGVNWSRAWMLHRLALRYPARALFREAFDAHVMVGISDHEKIATDYMVYGHWVPQFAVYALTEEVA